MPPNEPAPASGGTSSSTAGDRPLARPLTHREKLAHFDALLERQGRWKANAKPPVFQLLWKLGLEVPPPYFLTFGQAALGVGAASGLALAAVLGLLVRLAAGGGAPLLLAPLVLLIAVTGGALLGVGLALWWRWQGDQLALPAWRDFPLGGGTGDARPER